MYDVGFDEEIVVEKIGRKGIVGVYAPHATGGQKDDLRTMQCHPIFDLGLASEIDQRSAWIEQQPARIAPESTYNGASYHAMLTGDPDKLFG